MPWLNQIRLGLTSTYLKLDEIKLFVSLLIHSRKKKKVQRKTNKMSRSKERFCLTCTWWEINLEGKQVKNNMIRLFTSKLEETKWMQPTYFLPVRSKRTLNRLEETNPNIKNKIWKYFFHSAQSSHSRDTAKSPGVLKDSEKDVRYIKIIRISLVALLS